MTDVNVTLICAAGDKASADSLSSQYPGGAGTFTVPLATTPGLTDPAQATHYAGSGFVNGDMANAFDTNVAPMYKVFSNDGTDFDTIIANCTPPLYRVAQTGGL